MSNIQHHLNELKLRIFYIIFSALTTFFICYNYQIEIVYVMGKPFIELHQTFVFLELTEAFYTLLRISTLFTFLMIVPFVIYHLWCFFVPSFYQAERNTFSFFCVLFFFLFLGEILVSYFCFLPQIFQFLLSFEMKSEMIDSSFQVNPLISVEFTARIESYVKLVVKLLSVILVLFQIPLCIFLLYFKKILHVSSFYSNRKYLGLISLLVAAFIVPPDLISQLFLAVIFYTVFEFMVFIGLFFE